MLVAKHLQVVANPKEMEQLFVNRLELCLALAGLGL